MTAKGLGSLVFYDGRMNGENYISVIEPNLLPYVKKNFGRNDTWWYVQENTPCHRSDFTMKWIGRLCHRTSMLLKIFGILSIKKLTKYHPANVHDLEQIISKL